MKFFFTIFFIASFLLGSYAHAESFVDYPRSKELTVGAMGTHLLPFGIVGVRDSYPAWNVNFSHPTRVVRIEYSLNTINSKQVRMYNLALGPRIDFKAFDELDGYYLVGLDGYYYRRKPGNVTGEFPYYRTGGMHFGFGGLVALNGRLSVRGDFKFGFGPGKTLFVGVGLEYRFGGEESTTGN